MIKEMMFLKHDLIFIGTNNKNNNDLKSELKLKIIYSNIPVFSAEY